jgi:hypothetical protein
VTEVNGIPSVNAEAGDSEGIVLVFDQRTADLDALQRSAYAVAADMTIDIRASGTDYVCTLFPRKQDSADDDLKHRFRLEVNDQILRFAPSATGRTTTWTSATRAQSGTHAGVCSPRAATVSASTCARSDSHSAKHSAVLRRLPSYCLSRATH